MSTKKSAGPSGPAPDPIEESFAFECSLLGLNLDSYDRVVADAAAGDYPGAGEDRDALVDARQLALDAYRARDFDLFEARVELMWLKKFVYVMTPSARKGWKFKPGRTAGAGGPIRGAVRKLLEKTPTLKSGALWAAITSLASRSRCRYCR